MCFVIKLRGKISSWENDSFLVDGNSKNEVRVDLEASVVRRHPSRERQRTNASESFRCESYSHSTHTHAQAHVSNDVEGVTDVV